MKTAVVILNWNGKKFLEQFLPGVIRHSGPDTGIIVADNASTDGSLEFLRSHYPEVRLICHPQNEGFTRGYNLALAQVEAEYFLLLNSDIEVTPDWIRPLESMMLSDARIAACQPKILSWHQREYFEHAGAAGGYIDRLGYPFCRGRLFETLEKDEGQYDDAIDIFWATGACMFIRASVFREMGGFDDEFFAHMEEIDLCWRMRNKGYRIVYVPDSTVYHIGGGTLPKISARKTFLNYRNNLMLVFKNLPVAFLWYVIPIRILLDAVAALKFLFSTGWDELWAVVRAYGYFYASLKRQIRKRKLANPEHCDNTFRCIYPGSVVFRYYFFRNKYFSDLGWKP